MTPAHKLALIAALAVSLPAAPVRLFGSADPGAAPRNDSVLAPSVVEPGFDPAENAPVLSVEKTGAISTEEGLRLRVKADPGNVHIFTDASGQVTYRIRVEADSRDPGAEEFLRQFALTARKTSAGVSLEGNLPWRAFRGEFGVSYEIHIPRRYNVEVRTQGGNIELQDIDGRANLFTLGGDITAGRIDAQSASSASSNETSNSVAARLETLGGHISVGDVTGALRATTSGGHITAGNVYGDGTLHTGGGQIRAGRIFGNATVETGGGNLFLQGASNLSAETLGGQIELGEVGGRIQARTDGGAVRIAHVAGPTSVQTSGGLFLGQVDAPLNVVSSSGNVTAWLDNVVTGESAGTPGDPKARGVSQVTSKAGNIVVYLPRSMAASVDAEIEQGGGHRIMADASLPLRVNGQDSGSNSHSIHCEGVLNGGGELLRLKAVSGNIILKLGEPPAQLAAESRALLPPSRIESGDPSVMQVSSSGDPEDDYDAEGFFAEVRRRILESWWGGVPVDSGEMEKHLEHSVSPTYPEVARKAGIDGNVVLRVSVSSEGRVTDIKVLDGPPILSRAAVEAVGQWKYHPLWVDGRPTAVVTTIVISFRLH